MTNSKYIEDISEIRNMMEHSSRFLSLHGLSGILAGVYALIGSFIAYRIIYNADEVIYQNLREDQYNNDFLKLILLASIVFILATGSGLYLSIRKSKKLDIPFWSNTTKQMLTSLFTPLLTGGIFCLLLISKGIWFIVAPATLIFYGLALISASKYTPSEIKQLGICEVILGLISVYFSGYGLYFWAIGFGVFHIIYGALLYWKYEK